MHLPIRNYPAAYRSYLYGKGKGPVTEQGMEALRRRIRYALDAEYTDALTKTSCENLALYPELIRSAGPEILSHENARDIIQSSPFLAFHLLMSSYEDLASLLEDRLMESAELTGFLMDVFERPGIQSRLPPHYYELALLAEPLWALFHFRRRAGTASEKRRAKQMLKLREKAGDEKDTDPQSCLVNYLIHPREKITTNHRDLIGQDAMSSYLASYPLRDRGFTGRIETIQNLTSRWAAHIGLWGLYAGGFDTAEWQEALTSHPGWTAEFLAVRHAKKQLISGRGSFEALYEAVIKNPAPDARNLMWQQALYALLIRTTYHDAGKPCQQTIKEIVLTSSENAA